MSPIAWHWNDGFSERVCMYLDGVCCDWNKKTLPKLHPIIVANNIGDQLPFREATSAEGCPSGNYRFTGRAICGDKSVIVAEQFAIFVSPMVFLVLCAPPIPLLFIFLLNISQKTPSLPISRPHPLCTTTRKPRNRNRIPTRTYPIHFSWNISILTVFSRKLLGDACLGMMRVYLKYK